MHRRHGSFPLAAGVTVAEVLAVIDRAMREKTNGEALRDLEQLSAAIEARIVAKKMAVSIG